MPTISNKNHVELKFYDFDVPHEDISKMLSLEPTHFWSKGQEYLVGPAGKQIKRIRKENYWGFEIMKESDDFIGDEAADFLEKIVQPRIGSLKSLTERYHGEFSVVQYMYQGCNPGVYFDKKQLSLLNETGLELNIDFYVLSGASWPHR